MKALASFVALTALVSMACGLAVAAEPLRLSEAEAIKRATEQQAPQRQAQRRVAAAQARLDFAPYAVKNPELRLQDISTEYLERDRNQQFQIGLRWQPPGYGELGEKTAKARLSWADETLKARELRLTLVGQVRAVYAELALLQESAALALGRAELEERKRKAVAALLALGQRTLMDQVKSQTRALKAAGEAAQLSARLTAQHERLAALIGEPGDFAVEALAEEAPQLRYSALLALALRERPETARLKAYESDEKAHYRAARLMLLPAFSFVELAYHYESRKKDSAELMIGLELPLFNWNLGEIRATAIERNGGAIGTQALRAVIETELRGAWAKYSEALSVFSSVEEKSQEARKMLPMLIEKAQSQALPEDERIDLRLALLDLDELRLQARYRLRETINGLCRATGLEQAQALGEN